MSENEVLSKLQQAISKVDLLNDLILELDQKVLLEKLALIRYEIIYDNIFCNIFLTESTSFTLFIEFIRKINPMIQKLIKPDECEVDINNLLLFFSISHKEDYKSIEQLLSSNKLAYYDIPLLNCIDNTKFMYVEECISIIYMNVFYNNMKNAFTANNFNKCFSNLRTKIIDKYKEGLESTFQFERFLTMYRSIANPFYIKSEIKESAISVLKYIDYEIRDYMLNKWYEFVDKQFNDICNRIDDILNYKSSSNNTLVHMLRDNSERCKCAFYRWEMNPVQMADYYADVVADRCNLFAHANENDTSFWRTVASGYASIAISLLENLTEDGRNNVKKDVFRDISGYVSSLFDKSLDNVFSMVNNCYKV